MREARDGGVATRPEGLPAQLPEAQLDQGEAQGVLVPIDGFEAQFGYRFGDLRDPDFAANGGPGVFATFSVRITETVFPTSADFWRPRFGQK